MSSDTIIEVVNLGKCYHIFPTQQDRLKEFFLPKLLRLISPLVKLFKSNWQINEKYSTEFWALSGINFELKRGETVGIIGRNGSGKSTLLQLVCGTLTPTVGRVTIREKRIAALLELGAGFNPEFTGRENVYLNASLFGLSKKEIDERYEKILDFAEIGDFIHQPVKVYSSGMFVRLAFAVIANVDADVLIVDEALAVGDVFFQQKCMRFLNKFRERGAVLFVSHDTHSVSTLCNYAIWLDAGKIRAKGNAKQVCEQYYGMQYQEHALAQQQKMLESATLEKIIVELEEKQENITLASENLTESITEKVALVPDVALDDSNLLCVSDGVNDFGTRGAIITKVQLLDSSGAPLSWIRGGEIVELIIQARSSEEIENPIIGFIVKDRLGQYLFGNNTYMTNTIEKIGLNGSMEARFRFVMPLLRSGSYSIAAAIARGTIKEHVQLHWVHDAMVFSVHSESQYETLMNIPMNKVSLAII
jgi:lipopolysaccharide transport system ATP-binding protein